MDNAYLTPEQWERDGCVSREVLRKMREASLLGLMVDSAYGGAEADALTNLVFAKALSQSTFGRFIITVLVHTDMAIERLWRGARILSIGGGATEVMLDEAAKRY